MSNIPTLKHVQGVRMKQNTPYKESFNLFTQPMLRIPRKSQVIHFFSYCRHAALNSKGNPVANNLR